MKLPSIATSFGAVLAFAAMTAPADAAIAAGEVRGARDYGDAADGRRAGYQTRPGVQGRFPSLRDSEGSNHAGVGRLRLGDRATRERDSRQVDLDIADDGFVATLAPCRLSRLTFLVDASRLPAADRRRGNTIYLNAWLDWNRDGDWRDTDRCGRSRVPEWRVVNRAIDLGRFRREPRQAIQIDVIAGAQTIELWSRASVTFEERYERRVRASGAGGSFVNDGRGTFRLGETEDRLVPHEDVVANGGCGVLLSGGNMAFTQHEWGPPDVLLGRPAHKLTDGLLGINGVRPATAQLLPSNIPAGTLVRLTPGHPDFDFEVLYLEDGPPRTQIVRPRFRITSADGRVAIVTCVIFIDHGRFTAFGGGRGGPGSFPPGFGIPGGRLPGTPPPGTNPPPPPAPPPPGTPPPQTQEVTVTWVIQCAMANQTILNQRRVDIPANAVNPTHELLEVGGDTPALPPFCPGGPEMHFPGQVLQPGQGSPPATPGPGNNSYQASMRSVDAGGGTKTVRVRVRWQSP